VQDVDPKAEKPEPVSGFYTVQDAEQPKEADPAMFYTLTELPESGSEQPKKEAFFYKVSEELPSDPSKKVKAVRE
jgi:hypothetical protein